jgi:hypothetical protein
MAMAHVQRAATATAASASPATTFTVQNDTAGNTIVAWVLYNSAITTVTNVTDSEGNTYVQRHIEQGNTHTAAVYTASNIVGGTKATVTAHLSVAANSDVVIREFSGMPAGLTVDQKNQGTGNGTAPASGAITTLQATSLLLGGTAVGNAVTAGTAGWTGQVSPSGHWEEFRIITANETNNATFTALTGGYAALIVNVYASGGALQTVSPGGIASGAAFGLSVIQLSISPSGIASGAALGLPTFTPGPVTISPVGIAVSAALGLPTIQRTLGTVGIPASAALGLPSVKNLNTISPPGITTGAAVGLPTFSLAAAIVSPSGIAAPTLFGLPSISQTGPQTWQAASCSYADVAAAAALAQAGDTVVIPFGNCVWNATLIITKAITIQGSGTNLKRAPGFIIPFFAATDWNRPLYTVTGINFWLTTVAMSDHIGRIHFGKHLGGPYYGDVPNVWQGPLWTLVYPDAAHTFPNAGPTEWIDISTPEND